MQDYIRGKWPGKPVIPGLIEMCDLRLLYIICCYNPTENKVLLEFIRSENFFQKTNK